MLKSLINNLSGLKSIAKTRGEQMNVIIPTFVEQSWGEKQKYVMEALDAKYGESST